MINRVNNDSYYLGFQMKPSDDMPAQVKERCQVNSSRQEIEERIEEAEFELLFDDYITDLGKALQKEYEQAKARNEIEDMPLEIKNEIIDFIDQYNRSEEKKVRIVGVFRYLIVAVSACAFLFLSLFTVQAMGIDVFGKLGSWTDSIFRFESNAPERITGSSPDDVPISGLHAVMVENNIPIGLAPTWLPDGFALSFLDVSENDMSKTITAEYISRENTILYQVSEASSDEPIVQTLIEKDENEPELYHTNNMDYYVFSNNNNWVGVWQGKTNSIIIKVSTNKEDLISIIDSMGGIVND